MASSKVSAYPPHFLESTRALNKYISPCLSVATALENADMLENDEDMSDDQIALYRECYDRWRGVREEMEKNREDHGAPFELCGLCLAN
ncbi:uncharacterized protein N7503_011228 [Penicillium pulvis]|uniref:uncharacterized protein n=1 Tax=Penicillium pulvis TaxID=1562058 RepID=UPI002548E9C9|nr:uncharacterized protein N7503_011228 [Penicillium pulvis]KAJ5786016.1 hypothetical protein N7503_011228 [Penicillium pulvis]